jgi:hypothetical protein
MLLFCFDLLDAVSDHVLPAASPKLRAPGASLQADAAATYPGRLAGMPTLSAWGTSCATTALSTKEASPSVMPHGHTFAKYARDACDSQ